MRPSLRLIPFDNLSAEHRAALLAAVTPQEDVSPLDWQFLQENPVGYAILSPTGVVGVASWSGQEHCAMPTIWIEPPMRRKGLGRAAAEMLVAEMRRRGVTELSSVRAYSDRGSDVAAFKLHNYMTDRFARRGGGQH